MSRRLLTIVALSLLSVLAAAGSASAAPSDLPRLTGGAPTNTERIWFDDHSVIGDNHLSWSPAAGEVYTNAGGEQSQREPQGIRFGKTIAVGGLGGLEVCGYPSGTLGWMRAFQVTPGAMAAGSCPATAPATGAIGWFRYVFGRHSPTNEFNRWHLMDLERSALVPMPAGTTNAPATGTPTVWDNHWGTCLNLLSSSLTCQPSEAAGSLDAGVALGASKVTQDAVPDTQLIPIPVALQSSLPNGRYQVVALTNPYALVREPGGAIGSVSCVTVDVAIGATGLGEVSVSLVDPSPATCHVPTALDPALTGPAGFDPMAGAEQIASCAFTGSHCWTPDAGAPPHAGPFHAARSLATGDPGFIPGRAVPQGGQVPADIAATGRPAGETPEDPDPVDPDPADPAPTPSDPTRPDPTPSDPTPTPPPGLQFARDAAAPGTGGAGATGSSKAPAATAATRARSALRTVFGTGLSGLKVTCRVSTCAVRWRTSGAAYGGHVYLWTSKGRPQYRVDVTRRKAGRTTHVRRPYANL